MHSFCIFVDLLSQHVNSHPEIISLWSTANKHQACSPQLTQRLLPYLKIWYVGDKSTLVFI